MIETKKKQAGELVPLDALFSTADAIIRSSPTNLSERDHTSARSPWRRADQQGRGKSAASAQ